MTYTTQAGTPTRRRKQRRSAIVLGVMVAILAVALIFAWALNKGIIFSPAKAAPSATKAATKPGCVNPAAPGSTTVNVYNATSKNGLARTASAALQLQGFKIGAVQNDPLQKSIASVGEVRYGTSGAAQAKAVQLRVPGAKLVKDTRKDTTVDLALGDKFTKIATPAAGAGKC